MALLNKKIYIKNSSGIEQTVNLYSTAGEVGDKYANLVVDGILCYVSLCSTADSSATSGRVLKNNITYAISNAITPDYGYTTMTTAGSGTFTIPANVYKLRVTCVGGGAGGVIVLASRCGTATRYGEPGVATTFGSVTASGGTSSKYTTETYSYIGSCCGSGRDATSCTDCTKTGYKTYDIVDSQGYNNGAHAANSDWHSGGAAVPLLDYTGTQVITAGAGGMAGLGGQGYGLSPNYWISGASGYRVVEEISVTPGEVISWTVGSGGTSYGIGVVSGINYNYWSVDGLGLAGAYAGAILVEWGKGIQ